MVSTRQHPSSFSPPDPSTSKTVATRASRPRNHGWVHTPTALVLVWLFIALPLVLWDSAYVALRPHTMPSGKWHSPIFTPYALYGTVDYMYGWPAYESNNGFTQAQASMNIFESAGYLGYLYLFWQHGDGQWTYEQGQQRSMRGRWGGLACLFGFSLSVLTFSKTILYGLNEHFSGYHYIGHNDAFRLIFLWIIPNGLWIPLPAYMMYVFGKDILHGLSLAGGDDDQKQD